jgi:hypothetical protein
MENMAKFTQIVVQWSILGLLGLTLTFYIAFTIDRTVDYCRNFLRR